MHRIFLISDIVRSAMEDAVRESRLDGRKTCVAARCTLRPKEPCLNALAELKPPISSSASEEMLLIIVQVARRIGDCDTLERGMTRTASTPSRKTGKEP